MLAHLKTLFQYRDLLWIWTAREIKIRYKQSLLGSAWAILQPLSLTVLFTIVFTLFVSVPSDGFPYPVFAYAALLPWTFFTTSISFGVPSLVTNLNLVTKVYFPREILPLASIGAALLDYLVASVVYFAMLLIYQLNVSWTFLWVPLILLVQLILTMGIAFIGATINIFYRDVRFVVPLLLQLLMYASPVVYPISSVPDKLLPIYVLNPMAGLIDSYRRVLLNGLNPDFSVFLPAVFISVVLGLGGYAYFKREEWRFADLI